VLAAVVGAVVVGRGRQRRTTGAWLVQDARAIRAWRSRPAALVLSVAVWVALVGATVGWDLTSFMAQSHSLPTLSYVIGRVTRYPAGRGAAFVLWLGLGVYIAAGWRAEERG
jgi:hypothetical protein